jgi:DNA polymerase III gamma/tau subunit
VQANYDLDLGIVTGQSASLAFPQSLTEKYRPQRISDFIGLADVKKVLSAFCKRPHSSAWMFQGASGTGKSTLGMAVAAELRAEFHHVPSQRCNVAELENVIRQCWYVPRNATFHVVQVDECDQASPAAQLALLSKLDSTDPPPNTIFIFTCNDVERFEKRFLSRCRVLKFSTYAMRESLATFLAKVWLLETGKETGPDFTRIAKDSCSNVREALMTLEIAILSESE